MKEITIAIAGNPNCGKTTLFNALTGATQHVGNWPGVTVERMEGRFTHGDLNALVIDLPGIYSFSAFSLDEQVARDFVLNGAPDVVVNILDATNVERNLYLTTQLLEMKVPMVIGLNMVDIARRQHIRVEADHLSQHLGCPVIELIASRKNGMDALKDAIAKVAKNRTISKTNIIYDEEIEEAIENIVPQCESLAEENNVASRWLTIKLLENDPLALEMTKGQLAEEMRAEIDHIEKHTGEEIDIVIADGRYGFIHGLARDVVRRDDQIRKTVSDGIDRIALSRLLGLPAFFLVMYFVFILTNNVGGPFIDFFDGLCGTIFVDGARYLLEKIGSPEFLTTILADGVGGGIQIVATFIPPISIIFFCLSILEDSGYMSRAAFIMDRFLRIIGLPGKAFLPLLVGFGCNVPAIMATRTLDDERDRILTIMLNPFMSCGARLPVYIVFAAIFFPQGGGTLIFFIYLTGVVLAILTGIFLKNTILQGEASVFVMELPPYHVPTFTGIMHHTWNKLKGFILRAGKMLIIVTVFLTFINSFGTDNSFGNQDSEKSYLSAISRAITPVFGPMGIQEDNWEATVGLFTGLFAKEAVVGALNSLYGMGDDEEEQEFDFWGGIEGSFKAIPAGFEGFTSVLLDPLGVSDASSAKEEAEVVVEEFGINRKAHKLMREKFTNRASVVAYLLFILIYAPCVAAIAAIYRETNGKWTLFAVTYLTSLAWLVATAFYQLATFFSHPATSCCWLGLVASVIAIAYIVLRQVGKRMILNSAVDHGKKP